MLRIEDFDLYMFGRMSPQRNACSWIGDVNAKSVVVLADVVPGNAFFRRTLAVQIRVSRIGSAGIGRDRPANALSIRHRIARDRDKSSRRASGNWTSRLNA